MIYSLPPVRGEAFGTLSQRRLKCHQWFNFIKRLWGKCSSTSIHQTVVQLFPCLLGVNSDAIHAFNNSPCATSARKSSAWGFAGQGSTGPDWLKASADEAGGRLCTHSYAQERQHCLSHRERGRFVPLRGATQQGKERSKSWNLSCGLKPILQLLGLLWLLSCTQGPEQPRRPKVICSPQRTGF